jgi:diadenosine tetraphosphate (Ap4A) HIT family hydrolase
MHCPFCQLPSERILHSNEYGMVIRDGYPISPGHTLIIPKRHVGSFFDTSSEERNALLELLDWAKAELEASASNTEGSQHKGQPNGESVVSESEEPAEYHASAQHKPPRKPHAYNIGINDGPAAGQTVPHLHIHLIPRYRGDMPDPRGGVRWIMPGKADYWSGRE